MPASATHTENGERAWMCVRGWFDPADKGYEHRDPIRNDLRICRIMPKDAKVETLVQTYAPAAAAMYPKWAVVGGPGAPGVAASS